MSIWNDNFLRLAEYYKQQFFTMEGDQFLQMIGRNFCITGCFVCVYDILIKQKKIEPIEGLSSEDKWKLYEEAKRITEFREPEKLSEAEKKKHYIRVSKALHTLGSIIQM
jgi:hypothetical protein